MSIFHRVSFHGFALVPLFVLAACGGNGDEDGVQVELPAPGEYFFDIEATIEFTLTQPAVSAAAVGLPLTYSGQGTGSTGISVAKPTGGEKIFGRFGGMEITVDIDPGDDGFQIRITQRPDEESTLSENTEQEGTLASLFFEFQLPSGRIPGDGEGTATLMNVDPLLLGSVQVVDLTKPFALQGPDGYGPVPLTDEAGLTVGEFVGFDITLTPGDDVIDMGDLVEDGGDEEPEPPDEPVLISTDTLSDATECDSGAAVEDAAVDIFAIDFIQQLDGITFRVHLEGSPLESIKWFSHSVQLQVGQEGRFQVAQNEIHDGEPNSGRIDDAGNVIPGSEGDVTATDEFVTFFFPGLVLQPGDTVTARSFHLEEEGDTVHCDITDKFPLDEFISIPCGGECTREE